MQIKNRNEKEKEVEEEENCYILRGNLCTIPCGIGQEVTGEYIIVNIRSTVEPL
jgi:hypothetical protein